MENKELLQLLASLQIKATVAEVERMVAKDYFDPKVMAQVTALLKHHEVKADIKEVNDLNTMKEKAIEQRDRLLGKIRGDDTDEYVN